ncbi:MAG: PilZ domain-containing protein [Xanthomonadales bacterium]|nr:PilZ domain-containing protein [Xanthomonadales bacterium]
MSGAHRRRYPRVDVDEPVVVYDVVEDREIGTIGNISSHGLMLIGSESIEAERLMQLEFTLDHEGEARPIRVGAQALWCAPANVPDRFWTGFEIVDISEDDEAFLSLVATE